MQVKFSLAFKRLGVISMGVGTLVGVGARAWGCRAAIRGHQHAPATG